VALFSIPLFGRTGGGISSGFVLRVGAISGLIMTLLFIFCSVLPIVAVESKAEYSMKILTVVLGANLLGAVVYKAGQRKRAIKIDSAT
jgi:hypothetical protein